VGAEVLATYKRLEGPMKVLITLFIALASIKTFASCQYSGSVTPMVRDFFQAGLLVQIGTSATTMSNQVDNSKLAIDLFDKAVDNIASYDDAAFLQNMISSTAKAGRSVFRFDLRSIDRVVESKFTSRYDEFKRCSDSRVR
jgi:hypothetical protein